MADDRASDPELEGLIQHLQQTRQLDFRGYKRTSLRRRITCAWRLSASTDFAATSAHLEADAAEFADLLNTVLINVTSFFRDQEAWDVLKPDSHPADRRAQAGRPADPRSGASAARRGRNPIRSPCCSPRRWASE